MTGSVHGGGTDNVNLAALWIPVMPETGHLGEEMRQAGAMAKQEFEVGFAGGSSPDSLGESFTNKFAQSFSTRMANMPLPPGVSSFMDKMGEQVDARLAERLNKTLPGLYRDAASAADELTAAHGRLTEAKARDEQEIAKWGQGTISSLVAVKNAESGYEEAREKSTAANKKYTDQLGEFNTASASAFEFSDFLGGALGGMVVLGASAATEAIGEFVGKTIEGFEEAGKAVIEIGESYEHLGIQIREFSDASGEEFESLERSAARTFATLDVAGANTGQTMAVLAGRLGMEAGPALEKLTKHVEELQGRFADLNVQRLAAEFLVFGVDGDHADETLASFLQTSRNANISLGELTGSLDGVSETLKQAGLNAPQAGALIGEIEKRVPNARQAIMGFNQAMKVFSDPKQMGTDGPVAFADGLKLVGDRLRQLGDTAEGQQLAEKVFGTRHWADAMAMVQAYSDIVEQSADKWDAPANSIDEFTQQTEDLGNKWETLKHQFEDALAPFATQAEKAVSGGLDRISQWFGQHHAEISEDVKRWGDEFIDLLPKIQEFASIGLRLLEPMAAGLSMMFAPVAEELIAAGAGFLAITGHFSEAKDMLKLGVDLPIIEGKALGQIDKLADEIDKMQIDTSKIKDNFNNAVDSAGQITPPQGFSYWNDYQSPGNMYPNTPGQGKAPVPGPGGLAGGAPLGAPGGSGGGNKPSGYSGPSGGPNWDAIAGAESSGNWQITYGEGDDVTGGLQIATATWLSHGGGKYAPKAYMASKDQQIEVAQAVLADQGPTAWPTTYRNHPDWFTGGATGFAEGGGAHDLMSALQNFSGPKGSDTVLSYYTPGEYVWDKETTDKYRWLIQSLHKGGRYYEGGGGDGHDSGSGVLQVIWDDSERGGAKIGEASPYGWVGPGTGQPQYYGKDWKDHQGHVHTSFSRNPFTGEPYTQVAAGTDIRQGAAGFPNWVYQLGDQYGLVASTYPGHQEWDGINHGIDWWPKGKSDMSGSSYTPEDRQMLTGFAQAAGSLGAGGGAAPGPQVQMTGYGDGPSGYGGGPGGGGGRMTTQQQLELRQRQEGVNSARERLDDLDHQIADADRRAASERKKLEDLRKQTNIITGKPSATPEQIADAEAAASDAEWNAAKLRREKGDAEGKLADAQMKASEPLKRSREGKSSEDQLFEQLGGGLLKGIGQELGFGSLFGKPPWEWGIWKLFAGTASWGLNMLNNLGDSGGQLGGGASQSGLAGPGAGGDLFTGLGKSLGVGNLLGGAGQFSLRGQTHDQFGNKHLDLGSGSHVKPESHVKGSAFESRMAEGGGPHITVNGTYSPNAVTVHSQGNASDIPAWKSQQNSQAAQFQGSMPA